MTFTTVPSPRNSDIRYHVCIKQRVRVVSKCILILGGVLNLNAQTAVPDFPVLGPVQILQGSPSEKAIPVLWIYSKVSFNSGLQYWNLSHLNANTDFLLWRDFFNISVLTFAAIAVTKIDHLIQTI